MNHCIPFSAFEDLNDRAEGSSFTDTRTVRVSIEYIVNDLTGINTVNKDLVLAQSCK